MEREELTVSTKHKKLRGILFLLAFFVAIAAFGYGVSQMGKQEPGLQEIEAEPDAEAMMYAQGIHLQYAFEGSSDEIKQAKNLLRDAYSKALAHAYKLLDPVNEYEGYINVAYINHHPGEEITVSEELADILQDAVEKGNAGESVYNPYFGPVFGLWQEILYLEEPQASDPENDPWQKERLETIVPLLNAENVRLAIRGDTAELTLTPEVTKTIGELEMRPEIIDLGLMHDAYLVQLVRAQLNHQGWENGYLETDSGMILSLGAYSGGTYFIYEYQDGSPQEKETIPAEGDFVCSRISAFSLGEPGYYTIEDDAVIYRHPYISCTGYPADKYMITYVYDTNGDAVMAAYENILLNTSGVIREPHTVAYFAQERSLSE